MCAAVGAYRKCVLETEYPRVAAGLLPSWERLEQEAKRQGAALPGVHGGLPEHPDREQTSKHEEAKEGAGLTTPSFLRLTEYEKQGGVSAVAEKRIDDAGGEGNGKGTGKEERKESDKAFLQKVAQVAREAGLLSSESDSGNSSSSATSSSGTDSDASATSGMSTSSSSSASESATASDDAHKWHSPGTEDGSSSGGLTTKVGLGGGVISVVVVASLCSHNYPVLTF